MTEPKFTPGPWFAINDGTKNEPMRSVKAARIAGQKPRHEVAICATGDSPQEMENANAYLIATAPELYAELARIDPTNPVLAKARGEAPTLTGDR